MLYIGKVLFFCFFLLILPESSVAEKTQLPKRGDMQAFPKIYNLEVQKWISFFSKKPNSYFKPWLKKAYRYQPLMEKIFSSKGLPKELTAMSAVESSFSPHAISRANAVGYWQFIPSTGLRFGLTINDWIDERRDFEKSTKAAASYLSQLYTEFDDWLLAMSAYNMGETRLKALIRKHNSKNFWVLYKKAGFPRETALYIPKILATAQLLKYPANYGLSEFVILTPYRYDIFFVPGGTSLKEISLSAKIPFKELKKLNPDLKTYSIPRYIAHHPIRIPRGKGRLVSSWLSKKEKKSFFHAKKNRP